MYFLTLSSHRKANFELRINVINFNTVHMYIRAQLFKTNDVVVTLKFHFENTFHNKLPHLNLIHLQIQVRALQKKAYLTIMSDNFSYFASKLR